MEYWLLKEIKSLDLVISVVLLGLLFIAYAFIKSIISRMQDEKERILMSAIENSGAIKEALHSITAHVENLKNHVSNHSEDVIRRLGEVEKLMDEHVRELSSYRNNSK